jgi:uncharacterized protein YkwD
MNRKMTATFLLVFFLTTAFTNLTPPSTVLAAPSAYDLIAAVQALRSSKGLAPLIVDNALMSAAQQQSNYQAAIGSWSHEGAGGTRASDRAKAAGFGGGATVYISENVAMANNQTGLDKVIYEYWGDADHWNTMMSTKYIYAGAGVTEKNGVVYYTLNTGYYLGAPITPQATQPGSTPSTPGGNTNTPAPTVPRIVAIRTSTPNPDGSVIHPVGYGQAMISIATAYKISIEDLRKLNKMTNSSVLWAGAKLIIQPAYTPTPAVSSVPTQPPASPSPTAPTATRTATVPPTPTLTRTLRPTSTETATPTSPPLIPIDNVDRRGLGTVIIAVCGLGLVLVVGGQIRKKS